MDKRSFNFIFALLAISMMIMVTYKIKRKINQTNVVVAGVNTKAHH